MISLFKKLKEKYLSFRRKQEEKRINSYASLIRKLNVHKLERKAAIDFFCSLNHYPEIGVKNLLKRFDFSDDNSIVDSKEKEQALEGIIGYGEPAISLLCGYLKEGERIGWAIKALLVLTSDQRVSQELFTSLNLNEIDFDQGQVEKNYDILSHLCDFEFYGRDEDAKKVAHFLKTKDERVRLVATELMTERIIPSQQGDQPVAPKFLGYVEPFVYDESPENTRVRMTVIEAYVKHGWALKDKDRFSRFRIPGFTIHSQGLISQDSESVESS
ncbi:MAG: hypothetical protein OXC40_01990 [Proteobacteria bacterium]|nr:hypothetical protein [Pseudomonadota bacterium]